MKSKSLIRRCIRKYKEINSLTMARYPSGAVLGRIIIFNIVFMVIGALFITHLSLPNTKDMSFLEALFCTITMILDAGCIQFVIENIGTASFIAALGCILIVMFGMLLFTGAFIGFLSSYISNVIDSARAGEKKLVMSGHIVILNWNNRASEIVNDLLYARKKKRVVVLVSNNKEAVEDEIAERLADTIGRENKKLRQKCEKMPRLKRWATILKNRMHNRVTVIVRQGDVFSSKQLYDISVDKANSIIILGNDPGNTLCRLEYREKLDSGQKGNAQVVKTLMQVADITSAEDSADKQKIVVEVADTWTWELVQRIIDKKEKVAKCRIVPLPLTQLLGQLLSQFSLMPELNQVYYELFSNKDAAFYSKQEPKREEITWISEYLKDHFYAIPLTFLENNGESYAFYTADDDEDIDRVVSHEHSNYSVSLNRDYWLPKKTVIVLGHNTNCLEIMEGFRAFRAEWNRSDEEILRVIVIDDEESLKKVNFYRDYPFVQMPVVADIYDRETVCNAIETAVNNTDGDVSILILSDDMAANEDIDSNALANLIYVQDIMFPKEEADTGFRKNIEVIVEILDPKHSDIVNTYSVNNVVISNRYISKMVTQIGEKEALYDFYRDILTYDTEEAAQTGYVSKEIYAKTVADFFTELPAPCTPAELIRAVYEASIDPNLPYIKRYPTVVLGYSRRDNEGRVIVHLFADDQTRETVTLQPDDKLIVFTNH